MLTAKPEIAPCPACDTRIRFHQVPSHGDLLCCPECEQLLEVIDCAPIELDWAIEEDARHGRVANDQLLTWSD